MLPENSSIFSDVAKVKLAGYVEEQRGIVVIRKKHVTLDGGWDDSI
jgi:hypothetical protein